MSLGKIIRSWLRSIFLGDEAEDFRPRAMAVRPGAAKATRAAAAKPKRSPRKRAEPQLMAEPEDDEEEGEVRRPARRSRKKNAGADEAPAFDDEDA